MYWGTGRFYNLGAAGLPDDCLSQEMESQRACAHADAEIHKRRLVNDAVQFCPGPVLGIWTEIL
jgi:hypothetical protein